jgi:hypothetical protein
MELLLIGLALFGILVVLALVGWLASLVLQVGVVIQKAGEQPYRDTSTYSIAQGREPDESRDAGNDD